MYTRRSLFGLAAASIMIFCHLVPASIAQTQIPQIEIQPIPRSIWKTAITHPNNRKYILPPYPIAFVTTDVVENEVLKCPESCDVYDSDDPQCANPITTLEGNYHTGADVLSANDPSPGNKLWIFLPSNGKVKKLFPRAVHESSGLIMAPKDEGSVIEPNLSEDGTRLYFSYFHSAIDAKSTPDNQGRIPWSGADLYVIDLSPILANPNFNPNNLTTQRLTFRQLNGQGKQVPSDRDKDAMNQTFAGSTDPNEWGTVYMHPIEMRTKEGLKLVYVSNERRLDNSNRRMEKPNHNFNLHIADIANDGTIGSSHQFQYYTTTSALSPTPMREGLSFAYQSSTEGPRNWHIQGMDSEGRWYPILGYGSNPELFHLASFCVTASGSSPGDYLVAAKYYNLNNEGFGSLWRQDLSNLGKNNYFVPRGDYWVPEQDGALDITPDAKSSDDPSGQVGGKYVGKLTTPRCGGTDELFFAYTPTSANGRLNDLECNKNIYHSYIGYRPNLEAWDPLAAVGAGDGHQIIIDDRDNRYNLLWPVPIVPWSVRTGDAQQQFSATSIIDTASTVIPAEPFAQVGASALYNTDRRPFDCYVDRTVPFRPYNPQGVFNVNQETDLVNENQDGWTYVENPAAPCAAPSMSSILGIAVNLTSNKTNLRDYNFGYQTDGSGAKEAARLLGVYDVRPQDPDQSFQAVIPANSTFEFQLIDSRYGMKLTDVRSWHSLKPRETRTDCGGCHQHDKDASGISFQGTYADSNPPLDMVRSTTSINYSPTCQPTLTTSNQPAEGLPEWTTDIWPLMDQYCGSCHNVQTSGGTNAALHWEDSNAEQAAYNRIVGRKYASARMGAIGSQLFWAARGERTDGRDNSHPDLQANYGSGSWGFFFSAIHATNPGLCTTGDQTYATWVRQLGQWIDNHMPRDRGAPHSYTTDWFHPTIDSAIMSASCGPTQLDIGWWDDTDELKEIEVLLNDTTQLYFQQGTPGNWIANGTASIALSGVVGGDTITVRAMDPTDNRQIYRKGVDQLIDECLLLLP